LVNSKVENLFPEPVKNPLIIFNVKEYLLQNRVALFTVEHNSCRCLAAKREKRIVAVLRAKGSK
jgi:hypothetical protein